jgi:hypothetical protein
VASSRGSLVWGHHHGIKGVEDVRVQLRDAVGDEGVPAEGEIDELPRVGAVKKVVRLVDDHPMWQPAIPLQAYQGREA